MGLKDTEVSRLLAGEVPSDDPELGKVSDLLTSMRTALPPVSPSACEDRHLAVVTREARILAGARAQDRSTVRGMVGVRTRRALAATGAAVLVALTAGVGAAAAMGVNPLSLIPGLPIGQSSSPRAATPSPEPGERRDGAADGTKGGNSHPTPVAGPSIGSPEPVEGRPTADPTASGSASSAPIVASPAPSASTGNGKGNNGNGNGGGDGSNGKGNGKGNSGNGNGNGGGDGSSAGGKDKGGGDDSGGDQGNGKDKGKGNDAAPVAPERSGGDALTR